MTELYLPTLFIRFLAVFFGEKRTNYRALKAHYMGLAFLNWNRHILCLDYFNIAIIYFPKYTEAIEAKGICYTKLKEYDKAEACFKQILESDKDYFSTYFSLGNLEMARDNYELAIQYFGEYLTYHKGGDVVFNNRGYSFSRLGRYQEAILDLKEAIRLFPKSAYGWNNLGFATFKLGNIEKGLEHINYSIQLDPNNSYTYKNKAIICKHLGQKEEAIELLKKARSLNYNNEYGDEVDRLLVGLGVIEEDFNDHFIID